MNNTKHTPGRWLIVHSYNIVSEDGRRGIASAGGYQNNQKTEEVHAENCANARLIAAAPDLLAALEMFVEDFDKPLTSMGIRIRAETVDKARAVIARATGSEAEK